MNRDKLSFESKNLILDWISFNIQGLTDPGTIAFGLIKYFTPRVLIDDVPTLGFHDFKKKYKVSVRQYTGSKGYWVGTQILQLLAQTTIKKIFIEGIEQQIQNRYIQSKFHIVQKDNSVKYISQLRPINLTKSKYIYIYISMKTSIINIYLRQFKRR
jgi:hypothetical protein